MILEYTRRRCVGGLDYFYSEPEIARKYALLLCTTFSLSPFIGIHQTIVYSQLVTTRKAIETE